MISIMTRQAIHHMSAAGASSATIAKAVVDIGYEENVSERSVRRIQREPPPDVAAESPNKHPGPGRPSLVASFRHLVATLLEEEPHLQTAELLSRAHDAGYAGGKSAFYGMVKEMRRPAEGIEPIVRFEGVPGEYAQFDFGERRMRYRNGFSRKLVAFVGRLKYSRHVHVEIVPDQKAETLVRAVVACLEAWGCVPLIWVFDNPKTVRISKPGEPIELHPHLAGLAAELNAAVILCTPRQPQEKGCVENGVKWLKGSFLSQRRFHDENDVRFQLPGWLHYINEERPSDATGEIPAVRLEREREMLGPDRVCPFTAAEYALRIPLTVQPTGMVQVFGTSYSVDPKRVGAPAVAKVSRDTVEVVINGRSCTHQRIDNCDTPQRLPEHRSAMLGAIYGKRKHRTFKRQCLFEIGPHARTFLERMVHRLGPHGAAWFRPVERLFALLETHADDAMEVAFGTCNAQDRYDVPSVMAALREAHLQETAA